jgi:circadian clock protein KaiB
MHLALYVAPRSPNSLRALANLRQLLAGLPVPARVDIIDVFTSASEALTAGIIVTPTLLRLKPLPTVKIIGDLSDQDAVRGALGLPEAHGA